MEVEFEDLYGILLQHVEMREFYIGTLSQIKIRFQTALFYSVLDKLKENECSLQNYEKLKREAFEYVSYIEDIGIDKDIEIFNNAQSLLNAILNIEYDKEGHISNRSQGDIGGLDFQQAIEKVITDDLIWRLSKSERDELKVDYELLSNVGDDLGFSEREWASPNSLYSYMTMKNTDYFQLVHCVWLNLHPNDPLDNMME